MALSITDPKEREAVIKQVTHAHVSDPENVFIKHVDNCDQCRAERDSGKRRAAREYCSDGRKALRLSLEQLDAKLAAALDGWPLTFAEGFVADSVRE